MVLSNNVKTFYVGMFVFIAWVHYSNSMNCKLCTGTFLAIAFERCDTIVVCCYICINSCAHCNICVNSNYFLKIACFLCYIIYRLEKINKIKRTTFFQ